MQTRHPRGSIRRDAVVDAALRIVDKAGPRGLTMRALAEELGTGTMSLYTHFARKELLLDRMFDRVLERLLNVEPQPNWELELESACHHARRVLLAHPHWYSLLSRVSVPSQSLRFYDRLVVGMRKDGLSSATAMHAFSSALGYALGAVLVERMMSAHHHPPAPIQRLSLVREILPRLPTRQYRGVRATAREFGTWSFDGVFELGVRSLIAGLNAERAPPRHGQLA
jgi:AcrR family transcriptional regulator